MLLFEHLIWNALLNHTYAALEHAYADVDHVHAILELGGVIPKKMLLFRKFCFLGSVIKWDMLLNMVCFFSRQYGTYKIKK